MPDSLQAVRVKPTTKQKFNAIGYRHRIKLVEVAEVLAEAFERLSPEQQDKFIKRSGLSAHAPSAA